MEIIIVIVILGVLATLAIPKLLGPREQAIFSEGTSALHAMHGAQLRRALERSGAYSAQADCSDLDVTVTPKNFSAPACTAAGAVSVTRPGASGYTLSVDAAGTFTCPACPAHLKVYCPGAPCP